MAIEHFLVSSTTTAPPPASGGGNEPLASLEQRYSSKHPAQYIHASTPTSLVPNSIVRITCNSAPIYSVHLLLLLLPSCMTGSSPPSSRHTYPPLATLLRAAARRRISRNRTPCSISRTSPRSSTRSRHKPLSATSTTTVSGTSPTSRRSSCHSRPGARDQRRLLADHCLTDETVKFVNLLP